MAARGTSAQAHATIQAKAHRDLVRRGAAVSRPFAGTGGNQVNDENPGKADQGGGTGTGSNDPCWLVSRAQAQEILARPVATPQEAPLGPTCIYQAVGPKAVVTLAVEAMGLRQVRANIRNRTDVTVDGRKGLCGNYGQPTTFVPLAGGRMLDITAPCKIGARFAISALAQIPR